MLTLTCLLVLQDGLNDRDALLLDAPRGLKWLEVSPDGRRAACWAEQDGKYFVFDERGRGDACDQMGLLAFGPKGRRLGYLADRDKKDYGVMDGKAVGPVDPVYVPGIVFSPDGAHWAFMTFHEEARKEAVYRDGEKIDEFEKRESGLPNLLFTPEGRLAYRGVRIAEGRPRHHVIVDGKAVTPGYDSIGAISMSPDGKRLAFEVRRGDREFIVLDGAEQKPYALTDGFTFSPDGRRFAYMGSSEATAAAVIDGKEAPPERLHFVSDFAFSPDSKRLAYVIQTEPRRWRHVVLDGEKGPRFENAYGLTFSPDSKRFAYGVQDGSDRRAVIDGNKGPAFEWTEPVLFTPDGRRAVYLARDRAGTHLVVDHKILRTFERAAGLRVFQDGKRVGLGAVEGEKIRWRVVPIE